MELNCNDMDWAVGLATGCSMAEARLPVADV
jgi:hypothetical protein